MWRRLRRGFLSNDHTAASSGLCLLFPYGSEQRKTPQQIPPWTHTSLPSPAIQPRRQYSSLNFFLETSPSICFGQRLFVLADLEGDVCKNRNPEQCLIAFCLLIPPPGSIEQQKPVEGPALARHRPMLYSAWNCCFKTMQILNIKAEIPVDIVYCSHSFGKRCCWRICCQFTYSIWPRWRIRIFQIYSWYGIRELNAFLKINFLLV